MRHDSLHHPTQNTIDTLNGLLMGELGAVESYRKALDKADESRREALSDCQESHARRATLLSQRITGLGGEPALTAGLWGAIANIVTSGASLLGEKALIAALEEGEDRLRADYLKEITDLDPLDARFVEAELFVEQQRTHDTLSEIKRWLI